VDITAQPQLLAKTLKFSTAPSTSCPNAEESNVANLPLYHGGGSQEGLMVLDRIESRDNPDDRLVGQEAEFVPNPRPGARLRVELVRVDEVWDNNRALRPESASPAKFDARLRISDE
jgi:hypothetical protein